MKILEHSESSAAANKKEENEMFPPTIPNEFTIDEAFSSNWYHGTR